MSAPRDPGVSNERTALAWRRCALSLLTVAGLMLHAGVHERVRPLQLSVALALGIAAGWVDRYGHRVHGARADAADRPVLASPAALATLSGVAVVAAVVGVARVG